MSKKESEFDRYDRMKKLENESKKEKLKGNQTSSLGKKASKTKIAPISRKNSVKNINIEMDDDYDYIN